MGILNTLLSIGIVIVSQFGVILLAAIGLAVIFGMMGIINLAHGEFILIGAYGTLLSTQVGIPLIISMLIGSLLAGVAGLIVEKAVVQHLYDRLVDSMVATWGISLILTQGALIVFGSSPGSVSTPFGSVSYGTVSVRLYSLVIAVSALLLVAITYIIFKHTEFGLHARATMQDAETAENMGINTSRIYTTTFVFGSLLAGIAGSLLVPISSVSPNLGSAYIVEAFVTVVVGGASVLVGSLSSAALLSIISGTGVSVGSELAGSVLLLLSAVIIIRLFPGGLTEYIEKKNI